jgi:hypothetical protein
MFQIVRLELDRDGHMMARRPLQPLYELREDAMALAEFDASRCSGDYGYDEQYDAWWGCEHDSIYRFVIEEVACAETPFAGARDEGEGGHENRFHAGQ